MQIAGIYYIKNLINNKIYIGKSHNIKVRLAQHQKLLTDHDRNKKSTNRYLFDSVKKYGWQNFETGILEEITSLDEGYFNDRELYWMDYFKSYDMKLGYNLRRDSSTKCFVHDETKKLQSETRQGKNNSNYNHKWSDEQKNKMSVRMVQARKESSSYGEEYRKRASEIGKKVWENQDLRNRVSNSVRLTKEKKYKFLQYDKNMTLIKEWGTIREILEENPNYKWQNIYSVCNGYKPTIYGYIWRKELKI